MAHIPADVHPEEETAAWEVVAFLAGCAASAVLSVAALYVAARWLIAPIVRWLVLPVFRRVWPLLQPWVAAYGEQVLTAAALAVVVAILAIAREKK